MEYTELTKALEAAKCDTKIVVRRPSGEYEVEDAVFDEEKNAIVLVSGAEEKKNTYRIVYLITKDGGSEIVAYDTKREKAACDDDVIFNLEDYGYKYLADAGIEGEKQEKTGSVLVKSKKTVLREFSEKTGKRLKKPVKAEVEEKHYYRFKILEVYKEIDEENDIYARIWKDGYVA